MKCLNPSSMILLLIFAVCTLGNSTHDQQDADSPTSPQPAKAELTDSEALNDRVAKLEKRIEHLERLLFSTSQLSVYDAERRLKEATQRLKQTRRLYLGNKLARTQVYYDEFAVQRARKELQLAQAREGQFRISAEIELLQAEFELKAAERELTASQQRLTRGFVTPEQIRRLETDVERATRAAKTAREKLKAISDAELAGNKTAADKSDK